MVSKSGVGYDVEMIAISSTDKADMSGGKLAVSMVTCREETVPEVVTTSDGVARISYSWELADSIDLPPTPLLSDKMVPLDSSRSIVGVSDDISHCE